MGKNVVKHDASGKKACCHVSNAFLSRLERVSGPCSKKILFKTMHFWQKALGVNRLIMQSLGDKFGKSHLSKASLKTPGIP